ncbi:MAG: hypothetical protein ACXAC7_13145, partial [Candidatus Hodarchaeales archaeon]
HNLSNWVDNINKYIPRSIPRLYLSMKSDLKTEITIIDLDQFKGKHNVYRFIPVSAVTGKNVTRVFEYFIKKFTNKNN